MQPEPKSLHGRKVLVAGPAGFIGPHFCEGLVEADAEVIGIDELSAGKRANVAHLESRPNFGFAKMDVCESGPEMDRLLEGVDRVFHNAASKKNVCLV